MPKRPWFIFAFRTRYDPLERIVGGAQVRPFELFNAYAAAGHTVHIYETDGAHDTERSYHDGRLVIRPLRSSFGFLSMLPQHLEMRKVLAAEVQRAKKSGFDQFCFYNQVPVAVVFRFGWLPLLTQPGILLFDLARKLGMKTWGNVHDISPDHELSARERANSKIKMRNVRLQAAIHELIQRVFLRKSDFISTGSVGMKEALINRYGFPEEIIAVMQAGYNTELLSTVTKWSPPSDSKTWTVGYLGSHMDASLEIVIEALRKLGRPEVKLLLAGRGMSTAASNHDMAWPNTEVVEDATYSSFSTVANRVDVWTVPLLDKFVVDFAWQLKMPMYLASGRPIVRTRGKSLNDSGLSEYFFQTGSTAEEFAATIAHVIDNPTEAQEKAAAGLAAVVDSESWESVAHKLLCHLEKLSS